MTLAAYLAERKISYADFAAATGFRENSVSRYATGARIPRPPHMQTIARVTGGLVTANDFFGIAQPLTSEVAA